MMRVYFVRHGERNGNRNTFYASREVPLSEHGKRQAALVAERFISIPVEVIYSSSYVRTRETAEILNSVIKKEIRYDSRIEELGFDEPRASVFVRANQFVDFLQHKNDYQCILVSAHQGIIKMIVFAMVFGEVHLDEPFRAFDDAFHMDFTGITLCKYEKGKPWHIVTWNDLGHLPPPI
jgi:broad specificity phosphatase PhoE